MALIPFVGSETMVGLAIRFSYTSDIVGTCGDVVGTFGNIWYVWPVFSIWLKKKKPSGFYSLRLGGAAKKHASL